MLLKKEVLVIEREIIIGPLLEKLPRTEKKEPS